MLVARPAERVPGVVDAAGEVVVAQVLAQADELLAGRAGFEAGSGARPRTRPPPSRGPAGRAAPRRGATGPRSPARRDPEAAAPSPSSSAGVLTSAPGSTAPASRSAGRSRRDSRTPSRRGRPRSGRGRGRPTSFDSLCSRGITSPARSASSKSASAAYDFVPRASRRAAPRRPRASRPCPRRRRRTVSTHAASIARRHSPGITRFAAGSGRFCVYATAIASSMCRFTGSRPFTTSTAEDSRRVDLQHGGVDAHPAHGLGQAVVVGEDDHLAVARRRLQHAGQAVHARRVHRLHGIVDDDEPERRLGQRRARDEQRQRQSVQLALAHHAEGDALDAVHGHVQLHLAPRGGARQPDVLQRDVALLAELGPDGLALLLDGRELLGAEQSDGVLQPGLGGLQRLDGVEAFAGLAGDGQPGVDLRRERAPGVLAALDLGSGLRPAARARRRAAGRRSSRCRPRAGRRRWPRGPSGSPPDGGGPLPHRARRSPLAGPSRRAAWAARWRGGTRRRRRRGPRWPRGRRRAGASPPSPARRATRASSAPFLPQTGQGPSPCVLVEPEGLVEHVGQVLRSRGQRAGGRLQGLGGVAQRTRGGVDLARVRARQVGDLPEEHELAVRGAVVIRRATRSPPRRRGPSRRGRGRPRSTRARLSSIWGRLRTIWARISDASLCFRSRVLRASASRALRGDQLVEAEDRGQRVVQVRRPFLEHRAELAIRKKGPEADAAAPSIRARRSPSSACPGSARSTTTPSRGAPSGHSRLIVAGVFSPSTTNSASIDAFGWWRLRQPSFQTFDFLSFQRKVSPVSSSSRASAKLDLPEPLRPMTRVRPGPGGRSRVAGLPMPRKPSTVTDCR